MKREEAVNLYLAIRDSKNGILPKESMVKYVLLRIKLKEITEEFEKVRISISEETKPKDWKEGDSIEDWDKVFKPTIQTWLSEEIDIKPAIFNDDEFAEFVLSNSDKGGLFIDTVLPLKQ